MDKISIDDFKKIDIRIAKILRAEKLPNADKLLKLALDVGEKDEAGNTIERQILSGIALAYPDPSVLIDKLIPVIVNLEPRTMKGEVSNGMLLAATDGSVEGLPILLSPDQDLPPGSLVK